MTTLDRITSGVAIVGMVAVTGVVAYVGMTQAAHRIQPGDRPTITITQRVEEDSPGWNCLTMGNRTCGPDWSLITDLGVVEDITTTPNAICLIHVGAPAGVVCDDGTVTR